MDENRRLALEVALKLEPQDADDLIEWAQQIYDFLMGRNK